MANAINAGDAMFALAYSAMQRLSDHHSPELILKVWEIFNRTNIELTRGQHLDMRFETLNNVSPDDYISMIKGKTAALLAACSQMGALLGSADDDTAKCYYDFGLNIGIAFQIHDDILGIWGEPDVTGKSAATDIISQKKSIPVLYGLEKSSKLRELYTQPHFTDNDVQQVVKLLDQCDAETYTRELEINYHDKALTALKSANPQAEAAKMLNELVDFLFERQH
jgi:geranylgeranyl diphosphate synthase type I